MKKTVFKLEIHCEKCKKKAMKATAGIEGVDSVSIDAKEKKITVIGGADPVRLTQKLRKLGSTELLSVGPAKEENSYKHFTARQYAERKEALNLPKSCNSCQGFDALSDENPNACSIC
eukprot:Gb_34631 [translate_table: standard]